MDASLGVFQWNANAATTVGNSSILLSLDYSDTFTVNGTTRINYTFPTGSGLLVENTYGHAATSWTANAWKTVTNASATNGTLNTYPGDSGAGSATGLTQTSDQSGRWGINYTTDGTATGTSLRNTYAVQVDAVQTTGRIEITSKAFANASFSDAGSLSVFFMPGGISIYDPTHGETVLATSVSSLIAGQWENLAVVFSPTVLHIYVNQIMLLTVNLKEVGTTPIDYTGYSQQAVGFGFQTPVYGEWAWFDNFQVGLAAAPEPSTVLLLGLGMVLGTLTYRSRKHS